jgi:hypothetical protein
MVQFSTQPSMRRFLVAAFPLRARLRCGAYVGCRRRRLGINKVGQLPHCPLLCRARVRRARYGDRDEDAQVGWSDLGQRMRNE